MTTSIASVVLQLDRISRHNEQLQGENAALRAAISAIQDLHRIGSYRDHGDGPYTGCIHCLDEWPCPTITAIGTTP